MQFKTIAFAAAVGQATATIDLITNSNIAERVLGLKPEQVKNIDRAFHEATVPFVQVTGQVMRSMRPSIDEVLTTSTKVVANFAQALQEALTPETRSKIRTGIMNAVKTSVDAYV